MNPLPAASPSTLVSSDTSLCLPSSSPPVMSSTPSTRASYRNTSPLRVSLLSSGALTRLSTLTWLYSTSAPLHSCPLPSGSSTSSISETSPISTRCVSLLCVDMHMYMYCTCVMCNYMYLYHVLIIFPHPSLAPPPPLSFSPPPPPPSSPTPVLTTPSCLKVPMDSTQLWFAYGELMIIHKDNVTVCTGMTSTLRD